MSKNQLVKAVTEIVRQVVEVSRPKSVWLFGSAATGRWQPGSDLDLLVVVPDTAQPSRILDCLNTQIRRGSMPCDFLVVTQRVLRRQRSNRGLIYREVLAHGRKVYAR